MATLAELHPDAQLLPLIMRLARAYLPAEGSPAPYDPSKQRPAEITVASSTCERSSSTNEGIMFGKSDSDRKKDD